MERARPLVFVLTDGSGSGTESRLGATTALLERAGASRGGIYGAYSDRALYALLTERRVESVCALADRLADELGSAGCDVLVADAAEGYNPAHDLARMLAGAAAEILRRRTGRVLAAYEFPLVGLPDPVDALADDGCIRLLLSEAELRRKIAAARVYRELAAELEAVSRAHGLEAFGRECLRPAARRAGFEGPSGGRPFYETYGEQQVAAGRYERVLRWSEHVRPVAEALWAHAERAK